MGARDRLPIGALAWSLFEGARNPFVVLVTIYVFMPYFSSVVVGDPVRGQQAVATYGQWSGLIVALSAPFLGAAVDRIGRRKPMLLLVTGLMVPLIWSLWWTRADHRGLSVGAVIVIAAAINILFAYSEVLHNSMLVGAAGVRRAHSASGLALALGNLISVSVLVFVLWAFVLPAAIPGFVPHHPLFGLDPRQHEPSRIVAPIAAVILALGALPLFFLTPDAPSTGLPLGQALAEGARSMRTMLSHLKGRRDATVFLLSRMLYIDAMTGVLLFSGVYAAGVMHWAVLQLLAYGVLLSVLAVAGGFLGGVMDHRLGPKRAVQIEIGITAIGLLALIGIAPDRIFYLWHVAQARPVWNGPMFRTAPELVYLALAAGLSIFITASYASSRTLLTRLTPPEETGTFFGLYALSGTATLWIGSALVLLATRLTHTQQAGFLALAVLMTLGFIGLLFVRGGGRTITATLQPEEIEAAASTWTSPVPSTRP
ncbi:MFS transporter [Caulobacter sp. S45]|uniref:MFS transporter n=1 Tax=Caulobacter sp. S45 TaxID=1641861 RepID=UPI001576B1D6|nr:MFS transporter [Caulobacter sp. S45]